MYVSIYPCDLEKTFRCGHHAPRLQMHDSFFGNASLVSNSFEFNLADGVPLRGSVLTGYDSDLDFKVGLIWSS